MNVIVTKTMWRQSWLRDVGEICRRCHTHGLPWLRLYNRSHHTWTRDPVQDIYKTGINNKFQAPGTYQTGLGYKHRTLRSYQTCIRYNHCMSSVAKRDTCVLATPCTAAFHRPAVCVPVPYRCYSAAAIKSDVKKDHSALSTRRIVKRRKTKDSPFRDQVVYDVMAYSTADKYILPSLRRELLENGLYGLVTLPEDMSEEALYVEALYAVDDESKGIFFFKDGAVVFWNMQEVERSAMLDFLKRHQEKPHHQDIVQEEYEHIEYSYQTGSSDLQNHEIVLRQVKDEFDLKQQRLEKYTFSNSLALSVSLSIWEAMLDQYVESIEFILQDLKDGKSIRLSERDVLRKAGHLLTLRHLINLRSDLLDPPDAYWDREELEQIYTKTCQYLDIARRTRVMNEKLNHCTELMTMLQELLKDKHHTRLEWMIIVLIMIEVVFEIVHLYERWYTGEH